MRLRGANTIAAVAVLFATADSFPVERGRIPSETVILLHGLSRTHRSMSALERALAQEGYRVLNLPYPSGRHRIELLAEHLEPRIGRTCGERGGRVHFVTHSMGGIVLRYYLDTRPCPNLGRVVMLGPPNRGSELVDRLRRIPLLRDHIGPSRGQLGTSPSDLPAQLGPPHYEVGIIAGNRSLNPVFSLLIPGADDGTVSVERTKLPGMEDFVVLPHTHTFIMRSGEVIRQTIWFLREGAFDHAGDVRGST